MTNDLARKATERIEAEIFHGSLSATQGIAIASIIRDTYAQQGGELERLRADLEHCRDAAGSPDSCAGIGLENHALRQQVAELRADAERYWKARSRVRKSRSSRFGEDVFEIDLPYVDEVDGSMSERFDAAIDRAEVSRANPS